MTYLVKNNKIKLFAFVIMNNHIHVIWQVMPGNKPEKIKHSFMKFTAQQMKFELLKTNEAFLNDFNTSKKDRAYQFWKRDALSIELYTEKVFLQKLNYIHQNPVNAGLCKFAEDYKYSSAKFYQEGIDQFGILTDY